MSSLAPHRQTVSPIFPLHRSRYWALVPLFCIYGFLVHFGDLVRFGDAESSRGITTLVLLAILAGGITRSTAVALREPAFALIAAFLGYLVIPSILSRDPLVAIKPLAELAGYLLVAMVAYATKPSPRALALFLACSALGLFLSAFLTIVDFIGLLEVPRNNQTYIATKIGGAEVQQASGFFLRRSAMAAIFGISASSCAVLALCARQRTARLFFGASSLAGLLCLFFTHNRSGVIGATLAVFLFAIRTPVFSLKNRVIVIATLFITSASVAAGIATFFPDQAWAYVQKLGFVGLAETTWESDYARIALFQEAIRSLNDSLLGQGFTLIHLRGGITLNPHNILTQIIWAGGVVALIWLPAFALVVWLRLRTVRRGIGTLGEMAPYREALAYGLLAWLLGGMTHASLSTALAWIYFGFLLGAFQAGHGAPTRGGRDR